MPRDLTIPFTCSKMWKMNKEKAIEILGKIIEMMRAAGEKMDSPYDFENFVADYGSHSNLFATGKFKVED